MSVRAQVKSSIRRRSVNDLTFCSRIRSILFEYAHISTIHGLKQLFSVNSFRRAAWLILLIVCATLFVIQVRQKILAFFQDPIVTNIEMEYPMDLTFPRVMICNNNQYRISYVPEHLYHYLTDLFGMGSVNKNMDFSKYSSIFDQIQPNNSLDFLKNATSQLNDMLIRCVKPNNEPCNESDFAVVPTDFGICYAFNTNRYNPIKVSSSGISAGFYLVLDVEAYERMAGSTNTIGIKVLVQNQTSVPMVRLEGVDIPPGYKTNIAVNYIQTTKIPVSEGGSCVTDAPYEHLKSSLYSKNRCKIDKMIQWVYERCNCRPYYCEDHNTGRNISMCTVEQHFTCAVLETEMPAEASMCRDNCTTADYGVFLSSTKLPSEYLWVSAGEEEANRLYLKYLEASEIRERTQKGKVLKFEALMYNLVKADVALKEMRLAPMMDNFMKTYNRLKMDVPCYSDLINRYYSTIIDNDVFEKLDKQLDPLLESEKILHIIHPEIPVKRLVEDFEKLQKKYRKEITRYRTELRKLLSSLNIIVDLFRYWKFEPELTSDMDDYIAFFDWMNQYEEEKISKLRFAMEGTQLERILGDFTGNFLNAIASNVENKFIYGLKSFEMGNATEHLHEMEFDPISEELLVELVFQRYTNDSCRAEMDSWQEKLWLQWSDKADHPELLEDESRIVELCAVIPPHNLTEMISEMENCLFGSVYPYAVKFGITLVNVSQVFGDPFDELLQELSNYEWELLRSNRFYEENILAINVYFQDLSKKIISQQNAYDIWSLACDIGGTLGLFLGASVITLFEMFDFFILKPLCATTSATRKKSRKQTTQNGVTGNVWKVAVKPLDTATVANNYDV